MRTTRMESLLVNSPLFHGLDGSELTRFCDSLHERVLPTGTHFSQNGPACGWRLLAA